VLSKEVPYFFTEPIKLETAIGMQINLKNLEVYMDYIEILNDPTYEILLKKYHKWQKYIDNDKAKEQLFDDELLNKDPKKYQIRVPTYGISGIDYYKDYEARYIYLSEELIKVLSEVLGISLNDWTIDEDELRRFARSNDWKNI
jgi:hypothetical protein